MTVLASIKIALVVKKPCEAFLIKRTFFPVAAKFSLL